jgi:SAM-dependent methyltransferase
VLAKPKRIDPREADVKALIARFVESAEEHPKQQLVTHALLLRRDLPTLKILARELPRRAGMVYDPETLDRRAQHRIEQAFTAFSSTNRIPSNGPVVLEVGCARAENAHHVLAYGADCYIGVDPDPKLAAGWSQGDSRAKVVEAYAESLPFADRSIDLAVSFNVLEHVPDPAYALDEIARVLRPGGSFYTVFGPPFNASAGPHLTRFVDLPYLHHLFPEDVVGDFTGRTDPYCTVNRRPLSYYRSILLHHEKFEANVYREHITGGGFWLLKSRHELGIDLPLDELGVAAVTAHLIKHR